MDGVCEGIEVHCHCLPGLDDGPRDLGSALELCRVLAGECSVVIATPHQLGRYGLENSPSRVREAVAELAAALDAERIELEVFAGGEVHVDERIVELVESGRVSTIADEGRFLLLELHPDVAFDVAGLIERLLGVGVAPIIAHPERYPWLRGRRRLVESWLRAGAGIQLTSGSFLGQYGRTAYALAWELATLDGFVLVASDAHDARRRRPALREAAMVISGHLGPRVGRRLCFDHPWELLGPLDAEEPARTDEEEALLQEDR